MFPRHSRTHPFEIRIRSFGCTRSISSFHRVIWTSSPSASFALQSHTFPTLPERLVNSRTSPFDVTVRSIASTLLSGRRSFTFIRPSKPGNQDKHSVHVRQARSCGTSMREAGPTFLYPGAAMDGTGCTHAEPGEHFPEDR